MDKWMRQRDFQDFVLLHFSGLSGSEMVGRQNKSSEDADIVQKATLYTGTRGTHSAPLRDSQPWAPRCHQRPRGFAQETRLAELRGGVAGVPLRVTGKSSENKTGQIRKKPGRESENKATNSGHNASVYCAFCVGAEFPGGPSP